MGLQADRGSRGAASLVRTAGSNSRGFSHGDRPHATTTDGRYGSSGIKHRGFPCDPIVVLPPDVKNEMRKGQKARARCAGGGGDRPHKVATACAEVVCQPTQFKEILAEKMGPPRNHAGMAWGRCAWVSYHARCDHAVVTPREKEAATVYRRKKICGDLVIARRRKKPPRRVIHMG